TSPDRIGNPNANPPGKALKTAAGSRVVALALGRLDNDSVVDIVVAEQGAATGMFEVFLTAANGGKYNSSGIANIAMNTKGAIGMPGSAAPRAIAIGQSNLADPTSGSVDSDLDIFVATSMGIEIFENTLPTFTPQPAPLVAGAGT